MPKRILLVEDDSATRYVLTHYIRSVHPDAVIDNAETLLEACGHLSSNRYDAIVLDNQFPSGVADIKELENYGIGNEGEAGIALLRALHAKRFALNSRSPVYFHSTNMDEELSGSAKRLGAVSCGNKDSESVAGFRAFITAALSSERGSRIA